MPDSPAQNAPSPSKRGFGKWLLWGVAGLAAFAAMGVPMLAMMVFMGRMTTSMERMVVSVDQMSSDVTVMKDNLVAMGNYMNAITIGVASMDGNIDDIDRESLRDFCPSDNTSPDTDVAIAKNLLSNPTLYKDLIAKGNINLAHR